MGRTFSALRRFEKDNSGSAIITVVITIMFVVALSVALLFTAYMGMRVSVSARNEKLGFYDASAILDDIKAGLQDEVSAALGNAYTVSLVEYGQGKYGTDELAQRALEEYFLTGKDLAGNDKTTGLCEKAVVGGVPSGQHSFLQSESNITLDLPTLVSRYVEDAAGVTLTGGAVSYENSTITIKNLGVRRTVDGFESAVSSDIIIKIPNFFTGASIAARLGEYTLVADTAVVADYVSTSGVSVKGGVFAGPNGIHTGTNSDALTISGGNVVTSGEIKSDGEHSSLTIDSVGYEIWAKGLRSAKLSALSLSGSCFVADDLEINGGSDVSLAGSYFGFGSGTNSDASSSIFVNSLALRTVGGKDYYSKLDISKLYELTLSGVSFIHTSAKATNVAGGAASDLLTGQSMAIKTDQLAYLVPASAVKNYKTNPALARFDIAPEFDTGTFLWAINGASRNLAYYLGSGNQYGRIVSYVTQGDSDGNPQIIYFFLSFTDQNKANEYFRDFFTAKPDSITQYLDVYLSMSDSQNLTTVSKGSTYGYQSGKWSLISGLGSDYNATLANHYSALYSEMTQPQFNKYVKSLPAAGNTLTFRQGGKDVAIITNGNYIYDGSGANSIRLIVANGDVTVTKAFSGIIICTGTIHVKADITSTDVSTIKGALSNGKPIEDYLVEGLLGGQVVTTENAWSPDNLVYYENWQKN